MRNKHFFRYIFTTSFIIFLNLTLVFNIFSQESKEKSENKDKPAVIDNSPFKNKKTKKRKDSAKEASPVTVDGDEVSYMPDKRMVVAKGNVRMKNKDVTIYCDQAEYNAADSMSTIKGNVKIVRKDAVIYADYIEYDFLNSNAKMVNIRLISDPMYGKAKETLVKGKEQYTLKEGYFTTCDLNDPHYRIVAKEITLFPGRKIVARNIVIKIGDIPVFYFPYISLPFKDMSFPFEFVPGKKKDWGYYVLTRYRYNLDDNNKGNFYLDWYEKRGWAEGIVHQFNIENLGEGTLNYYYLKDKLYATDKRNSLFDIYPDRSGISPKYLDDSRFKGQFTYFFQPIPQFTVRSEIHKFSDKFFMKDFFYREYDRVPEPLTYCLADYSFKRSDLSILGQKRVNHFYSQTEYLPQVEYNLYTQKIFNSPLYIRSKTVGGVIDYKAANSSDHLDAVRLYSHNVISCPVTVGHIFITPYVGGYLAGYSKDVVGQKDCYRGTFNSGIDIKTKLFKTFQMDNYILGEQVSVIRHVITPILRYDYIRPPTILNNRISQIDELDNLPRKERITFALENKVQAKNKKDSVWDFVYFSPSVEYVINDKIKGNYFDLLKADLELYPRPGIALNLNSEYNCDTNRVKSINSDITFHERKEDKYSVSLGQRYTQGEGNQSTVEFNYKLSSKLQWRNYLRYDAKSGKVQEQQYTIRRDLHCWWLDFGVNIDKYLDYTVWAACSLKAFPDIHVGFEQAYEGARRTY